MENNTTVSNKALISKNENDKIDLIHIVKLMWIKKKAYFLSGTIAVIIGIIIAFSIPPTYTSEVILAPEIEGGAGSLSNNLSNLASMAGIDLNINKSSIDALYPEIYPQIVSSTPFLKDLLKTKIRTKDKQVNNITAYEYLIKYQKTAWWNKLAVFFKKKSKSKISFDVSKISLFEPTKLENDIFKALNNSINCNVDTKTSIITIQVTTQDPLVSAILAEEVKKNIQTYITDYRTKKARTDLAYAEKLVKDALNEYKKSQKKYAEYADANEDVILQSFSTKRDEMENNMQLRYNIYNTLVQQVQTARAKVQERTPAFTEIQPATVPLKKSAPKRMTIVILFAFMSFVITTFVILIKDARLQK